MSAGPVERFSRARGLLQVIQDCNHVMKTTNDIAERNEADLGRFGSEIILLEELNALEDSGAFDEISKFLEITYGGGG